MVQTVRRTTGVPQLLNTVAHVPVVQVELDYWCRREGDSRDLTAAAVEKSLAPGGPGSSPWWSWADGWIFLGPVHRYRAGGRIHRDTAPIIRCLIVGVPGQTRSSYTVSEPQPPQPPQPTTPPSHHHYLHHHHHNHNHRGVASSVAWSEHWVSFLLELVDSYLARLVGICPSHVILGGITVPMG